jgi:hypothetical protein
VSSSLRERLRGRPEWPEEVLVELTVDDQPELPELPELRDEPDEPEDAELRDDAELSESEPESESSLDGFLLGILSRGLTACL